MRKIKITLRPDGTQKIEVLGAAGPDCVEFTSELERRLGTHLGERQLKPEYDEEPRERERDREVER